MAAAVDRRAGLDADEVLAALLDVVLHYLEAADDAGAVKVLIVMPQLVDQVSLLVDEIARQHQLAGPVRIPQERLAVATVALGGNRSSMMVVVRHGELLLRSSIER